MKELQASSARGNRRDIRASAKAVLGSLLAPSIIALALLIMVAPRFLTVALISSLICIRLAHGRRMTAGAIGGCGLAFLACAASGIPPFATADISKAGWLLLGIAGVLAAHSCLVDGSQSDDGSERRGSTVSSAAALGLIVIVTFQLAFILFVTPVRGLEVDAQESTPSMPAGATPAIGATIQPTISRPTQAPQPTSTPSPTPTSVPTVPAARAAATTSAARTAATVAATPTATARALMPVPSATPPSATLSQQDRQKPILVLNGGSKPGSAGEVMRLLRSVGFGNVGMGDSERSDYVTSLIEYPSNSRNIATEIVRVIENKYPDMAMSEVSTAPLITVIIGSRRE